MAQEKIKQFRTWMAKNGLDAYLVPHADRFQSEYLREEDERLAWLTGFTGSSGMAVVTAEKAVVFTNGIYALQAPKQVDGNVFDVVVAPPTRPVDYLVQHLADNAKIGFDPWLFTVTQMRQWQTMGKEMGWEFVAVDENPIDVLWADRPVGDIVAGEIHTQMYAGVAREAKIQQVLQEKSASADSVLISDPGLVCWLLNIRGRDVAHIPVLQSLVWVRGDGHVTLFADPAKITDAMRQDFGNHVTVENMNALLDVLAQVKEPIQIDPALCPVHVKKFLDERSIANVEFIDPTILLRACKNETEINGARAAQEKDRKAFERFLAWYHSCDFSKETITEQDVADYLAQCRAQDATCLDTSFTTIPGYGANGALPHYRVTPETLAVLKPDNLFLLDSGGQYREGTTDITRTFAVGKPSSKMKTHYTAVLQGLIALSLARFPVGVSGARLDTLARLPLWRLGLDYAHGTGHGVGSFLSVHEGPQGFSMHGQTPLREGMILSVEPGVYFEGEYGIRLENLVVVVDDTREGDTQKMLALETMTFVPFESRLIDWDVLSAVEIEFLERFDTFPS